jgi:alpha-tubulin suppressor-like RCC1 family protein
LGEKQFLRPDQKDVPKVYRVRKPWRLRWVDLTNAKVVQVACGNGFSLLVVAGDSKYFGDRLYGTGMNSCSQIGVQKVGSSSDALKYLIQPALINIPFEKPHQIKILNISCGRAHSIVNTNEGVFSFGHNAYGQCGRTIVENEDYFNNPAVMQKIHIENEIISVKCGQDHSCFLAKDGSVYTCGWSADGQLGQNIYSVQSKPSLVIGDISGVKIKHLSTKGDFVLALSDTGELFGWGNNEYKQLYMSGVHDPQIGISKHIKLPSYVKTPILDVAASGTHCMVLDSNRRVWVWGYGLLGRGPVCEQTQEPLEIPQQLLGKYEELKDTLKRNVEFIHCGLNCSAIIMNDGSLYMWGKNNYGIAASGNLDDIYFPLRVNIPAQVLKIDFGVDQAFSVCKSFI